MYHSFQWGAYASKRTYTHRQWICVCKHTHVHVQGSMGRSPWSCCCQGEGKGTSVLIVLSSLHHCIIAGREGKGVLSSSSRGRGKGSITVLALLRGQGHIVVRLRLRACCCQAEAEGKGDHESMASSLLEKDMGTSYPPWVMSMGTYGYG